MAAFASFLFHAHSGLRYLVLLAGVVSLLYSVTAAVSGRPWDRGGRVLLAAFTGLLDVQVLLGLILVFVWPFYPALWGHIVLMILAAVTAHVTSVLNRRRAPERKSHRVVALGAAVALVLLIGGIMAIGRSIV